LGGGSYISKVGEFKLGKFHRESIEAEGSDCKKDLVKLKNVGYIYRIAPPSFVFHRQMS